MRLKLIITDTVEVPDSDCINRTIAEVIETYKEMTKDGVIDPLDWLTESCVITYEPVE